MRAVSDQMQISFLLSTVLAACLGCAARHLSSDPGVAGNGIAGRVAFELLADPTLTAPAVSAQLVLMSPAPLDVPLPDYPVLRLATEAAPVVLVAVPQAAGVKVKVVLASVTPAGKVSGN